MAAEVRPISNAPLPPPRMERGVVGWVHANLFGTMFSGALTVASSLVIVAAAIFGIKWILLDADWSVIATLGGQMIMGQYNTEAACPSLNCFWRPQASLLLVTGILGMVWGVVGGGLPKRIGIGVAGVLALIRLASL